MATRAAHRSERHDVLLPGDAMSALAAPVPPGAATVAERMTPKAVWTLAITSIAVFMVTLDNLVVTTAIPVIRQDRTRVSADCSGRSTPTP
jgi:hypothetical protein